MEPSSRTSYAAAGLLSTGAGVAAGHLVAALTDPAASPVLAVGSTVIDLTPTPVKEWAVRELGTADKPVLLASVALGTLALAGGAGLLARRSARLGALVLLGLVALAGVLAMRRPAATAVDVLPALVAAVVGLAVFALAVQALRRAGDARTTDALEPGSAEAVVAARASRRGLLLGAGTVAALSAAAAATGQWVIRTGTQIGDIVLPRAAKPLPPLPTGLEEAHDGISPLRTTNARFYRVDTNLVVPRVDVDSWRLRIDGDVRQELTLTYDDLRSMPLVERDITLTCVSNEVGGKYVGAARWLGVPLKDLLDQAGVGTKADQLLSTAVDGFTISTPLDVVRDGRDVLVAIGMNGEPLPADHGFPARLVTPGVYGFVGATKWLTRLTLTTYAAKRAYWTKRGWATDAPIKVSARIDTPRPLSTIKAGRTVIGGVAWAQHRGIRRVEVRIDGGAWQTARLGPDVGVDYWRQWYLPWDAPSGRHLVAVRAVTLDGDVQTAVRRTPFPDGSSGIQEVVVTVA
ncbi:molybdopterin-dependent oxidoreductase [Nocardioides jiangxiensis]|uniref:Molybdopterin-dependent oxidoreductase n=1 Tax=Nocardioides jiangxiensis TaxID=3064524 RepID=A0ABT9AZL6_9ACTN|nr:molybdopterin-dependent oxidoreductase [Nocardioides sp. WY-20]MDO7868039.1 molybdopterin-dependent oxidoreductase [Nocardioides sp. WY-20]